MSVRHSARWLVVASLIASPCLVQAATCDATHACVTVTTIYNANGSGDLLLSFAPRSSDALNWGLMSWSAHLFGLEGITGATYGALGVDPVTHAVTGAGDFNDPTVPLSTFSLNQIAQNGYTADFRNSNVGDVSGQFGFGHPQFLNLLDIHFDRAPSSGASILGLTAGNGLVLTDFGVNRAVVDNRPDNSVPEIDAASGSAAIALLLGMGALLFERRGARREPDTQTQHRASAVPAAA